jgi:hypothetical protein
MQVSACQVIRGDYMRDHGSLREVTSVQASKSDAYMEVVFELVGSRGSRLVVPLHQDVSVWRLCRDR